MNRFVMTRASVLVSLASLALFTGGCDKKSGEGGGAASSASAASSAKPTAAATSAAPAANLPVKGPWEAIKITMTKKDPDGTGHFKIENLGSKTVTTIFIDVYGYDAKGKQVVHKDHGFNREIKGGGTDEFTQDPVKDVDTWEAVYHGLKFEGDSNFTTDDKRAPAHRAKGAP